MPEIVKKEDRDTEIKKYVNAYRVPHYHAGAPRMLQAMELLQTLDVTGSLLDVSCGRREFLLIAKEEGYDPCCGTEVVPELIDGKQVVFAEAHALPFDDDSFDVVTSWDVIEHLLSGDDEQMCREMERVAKRYVLISANNKRARCQKTMLHINRRLYSEWISCSTSGF